jgi:transketolase
VTRFRYVGYSELERIRRLDVDPRERVAAFADACRINVLYEVARAGSGHLGTSFSCLDIVSWLHLEVLRKGDRYFSSKGHDAPALYAVLAGLGRLPFEKLHRLRRLGGLPGHPDVLTTPQVVTNTGSLGMGISKARGFVLADRLAGRRSRVFVLTGDGELQEGQFWESLQPTANRGIGEITVVVDHNKIQSDTWVEQVSDLGRFEEKVAAFGWATARCDGNDLGSLADALEALRGDARPKLLIAETRKGSGVSFFEPHDLPDHETSLYGFHSGAPSFEDYARALAELELRVRRRVPDIELTELEVPAPPAPAKQPQRLIQAWSDALVAQAEHEPRLVALDADLRLDTGLVEFQRRFPERFFECGIAEQDMVSQAGAMALAGLLPVCHSFACFLTPRANEQVFNNASEGTRIIYHGSLAGLVPGGPGHSHQMVRDIALMGSVPGMSAIEPYCEREVELALDWAVREAEGPVYVRLVSPPWQLPFDAPPTERLEPGRGTILREGSDGAFVCTGPVLVSQAWLACDLLDDDRLSFGVVALPWLTSVDAAWLTRAVPSGAIVCVDNHVRVGGQGEAVLASLAAAAPQAAARTTLVSVEEIPVCGTNDEVLREHGLDAAGLASRVRALSREGGMRVWD